MTVSEKVKAFDNKIEKNKAQYNLDRWTATILALSSVDNGKYEFLTDEDVFPEKGLLEKDATIKGFEYLLIGSKLKNQTIIAEKQYQKFEDVEELTTKNNKEPTIKKYTIDQI